MQLQLNQLTADLRAILDLAQREAAYRHAPYVDIEHLALGLFKHPAGTAHTLFAQHSVDTAALYDQVAAAVGMERDEPVAIQGYTKWANAALERALDEARSQGHVPLAAGHLLIALMRESEGVVHDALTDLPFDTDAVRAHLLEVDPPRLASDAPPLVPVPDAGRRQPDDEVPPEIIVIPTRRSRRRKTDASKPASNMPVILAALLVLAAYVFVVLPTSSTFTFILVLGGWIFSLTLHEFAHALVAYWGGDYTVREKGYLSFNPIKYTHPMLSIVMPLLFLAMGGIGLPGGAVYIEKHRLRSKWWSAAVSAAGPAANLLVAIVLSAPFWLGLVDAQFINFKILADSPNLKDNIWQDTPLWTAVAFLVMLQITAVFLNLLPIPPLDGFGILEPFLDEQTRFQLRQLSGYGILLVFAALWLIPQVNDAFFNMVFDATITFDVPRNLVVYGYNSFLFWQK